MGKKCMPVFLTHTHDRFENARESTPEKMRRDSEEK